ncbi:MAG: transcriptional regulator, MerR family [Citricoccus sp.]|nr:transcriptional regulator, MerR family [Citricoccus sp. WCRC_4]
MTTQTVAQRGMRIGELAAATSLSPDTIRYYEKAGLLPDPARTPAGYRAYGPEAVDRLHFIQGAQRLGLRLEDIRNLLAIRDTGTCPCEPAADFLARRLTEVDAQIRRLESLRTEMVTMLGDLPAGDCPQPTPGTWLQREGR